MPAPIDAPGRLSRSEGIKTAGSHPAHSCLSCPGREDRYVDARMSHFDRMVGDIARREDP